MTYSSGGRGGGGVEPSYPPFNPFLRHPTSALGKFKMLVFGLFLVSIRAVGAMATLASCLVWCNVCSLGCDDLSKPYSLMRRRLLQGGCRVFSRVLLFWYGFVWIDEGYEVEDPRERAEQPPPSVIVVNHIGFAELIYLVYSDGCCFVSKDANRSLPFIGKISEILQSIFVYRGDGAEKSSDTSGDGANENVQTRKSSNASEASLSSGGTAARSTTERILERARSLPGTYPPLCICPEGTTHTGHIMIKFATGAFRAGLPIRPVVVSSPFSPVHGYDPSFSCANIVKHILCLMTQPTNRLNVKHLAVYVPSEAEKKDPHLYAENVRRKMANELRVQCYDLTWTDKLRFERSARSSLRPGTEGWFRPCPYLRRTRSAIPSGAGIRKTTR